MLRQKQTKKQARYQILQRHESCMTHDNNNENEGLCLSKKRKNLLRTEQCRKQNKLSKDIKFLAECCHKINNILHKLLMLR
jgi:hypothetical protein